MLSFVNIFATFLGENPIARRNRPAGPLDLPDDFAKDIGTLIRQGLMAVIMNSLPGSHPSPNSTQLDGRPDRGRAPSR